LEDSPTSVISFSFGLKEEREREGEGASQRLTVAASEGWGIKGRSQRR